jgi:hypothetical protein
MRRSGALLLTGLVLLTCAACGRIEETGAPSGAISGGSAPAPSDSPSEEPDGTGTDSDPTDDPLPPLDPPSTDPEADTGAAATPCNGRPSVAQIVAAIRRDRGDAVPAGVTPTASTGPLCADSWQYTVLSIRGRDPLQVITRGTPAALKVVTAGTYVCTAAVNATAPTGIRTAANCTGG